MAVRVRKKIPEYDAVKLTADNWDEVKAHVVAHELAGRAWKAYIGEDGLPLPSPETSDEYCVIIQDSDGTRFARRDDWIIRPAHMQTRLFIVSDGDFNEQYERIVI